MKKKFDVTDLNIIEALAAYGPRNVAEVSRRLRLPTETLRKRIKRLSSQHFLRFNIAIHHARLGLKKALVFTEAIPGYEDVLLDALKINEYWIFACRCYGMFEGCVGIFVIPNESCDLFEHFIGEFKRIGLAKRIQIFWLTHSHSVHSLRKWFNEREKTWNFNWEGWVKEIGKRVSPLSYPLLESKASSVKVDEIDVLILKELEKDARISFKRLGEKLGISLQLARYHYYNHIVRGGMLKNFEVSLFHFGKDSEFSFFIFSFYKKEKLVKFASSLMDKPFVSAISTISGGNQLYAYLYFPRHEFRRFLCVLSELVKNGILKSYEYVIQDLNSSSRETIPFQCFKDGKWIYAHERYVKILHKFLKEKPSIEKLGLKIYTKK